jgi:hypothetical protein
MTSDTLTLGEVPFEMVEFFHNVVIPAPARCHAVHIVDR